MSDPKYSHIGTPIDRCIEECSELIQALVKVKRFGWFNFHPETHITNIVSVKAEMDDVVETIEKLQVEMRQIEYERYRK